ncbi:MAG: hypothetical protein WBJ81_05505 [Rickettsiales bacterium]
MKNLPYLKKKIAPEVNKDSVPASAIPEASEEFATLTEKNIKSIIYNSAKGDSNEFYTLLSQISLDDNAGAKYLDIKSDFESLQKEIYKKETIVGAVEGALIGFIKKNLAFNNKTQVAPEPLNIEDYQNNIYDKIYNHLVKADKILSTKEQDAMSTDSDSEQNSVSSTKSSEGKINFSLSNASNKGITKSRTLLPSYNRVSPTQTNPGQTH